MRNKRIITFAAAILAVLAVFSLSGCCLFYDFASGDTMDFGYSKLYDDAYVARLYWDGDRENMTFVVPDVYEGCKLTSLGGYHGRGVPCHFGIDPKYGTDIADEINAIFSDAEDDTDYETLVFTVKLGKNIQKVELVYGEVYWGVKTSDCGPYDALYKIAYRFEVDSFNPVFESDNGVLKYKSSHDPVPGFFYG